MGAFEDWSERAEDEVDRHLPFSQEIATLAHAIREVQRGAAAALEDHLAQTGEDTVCPP